MSEEPDTLTILDVLRARRRLCDLTVEELLQVMENTMSASHLYPPIMVEMQRRLVHGDSK